VVVVTRRLAAVRELIGEVQRINSRPTSVRCVAPEKLSSVRRCKARDSVILVDDDGIDILKRRC
jgi:hypothetical protein